MVYQYLQKLSKYVYFNVPMKKNSKNRSFLYKQFHWSRGHIIDVTMIKSRAYGLTENSEQIDIVKCRYSN